MWVLGSESHYTVLFSLDKGAQDESQKAKREKEIRKIFDEYDTSGGGGFIDQQSIGEVLSKARCAPDSALASQDLVTWHELWASVVRSEFAAGGDGGMAGEGAANKRLEMYHVNGYAKGEGSKPVQKAVAVTLLEDLTAAAAAQQGTGMDMDMNMGLGESRPAQWCPLVDCIRTRWKECEVHWHGDAPSIV